MRVKNRKTVNTPTFLFQLSGGAGFDLVLPCVFLFPCSHPLALRVSSCAVCMQRGDGGNSNGRALRLALNERGDV